MATVDASKGRVVDARTEHDGPYQRPAAAQEQQAGGAFAQPQTKGKQGNALPHLHVHGAACHDPPAFGKVGVWQMCGQSAHNSPRGNKKRTTDPPQTCKKRSSQHNGVYRRVCCKRE